MIIQKKEDLKVNKSFEVDEARRIALLIKVFGKVELSEKEVETLVWLAGWEESIATNIVSAIQKVITAEQNQLERQQLWQNSTLDYEECQLEGAQSGGASE